jgi:hypothetical protein
MKISSLTFIACILFCSVSSFATSIAYHLETIQNTQPQNGGPVKLVPVKDPQSGMIICKVPVPNDWTIGADSWEAPGNTKIQEFQGQMLANNMSADEFIKTQLIPEMKATGNRILNVERYPFIEEFDRNYREKLWTPAPTQNSFTVKGIEFEDNNGIKGLIIIHHIQMKSQNGTMTHIYAQAMEGDKNFYPENKKALLYAVSNIQYNPQFIQTLNQMQKQQMANSR